MEMKEKIKKLSSLQSIVENVKLQELIQGLPEGRFVWEVFVGSVENQMEILLSGESPKVAAALSDLEETIKGIESSKVLAVLQNIQAKLEAQEKAALENQQYLRQQQEAGKAGQVKADPRVQRQTLTGPY